MIVESLILKTKPGKAEETTLQLKRIPNVSTHGIYKENNIIVVLEVEKKEEIYNLSHYIMNQFRDVLVIKE